MRYFFALAATLFLLPAVQAQPRVDLANRRAPSWALPDTKMQTHDILDYRGRWLMIAFTETRCERCKFLARALEGLRNRNKDRVDVVSVMIPPENMATAGAYINETKITYPIIFDSSQMAITYFKATPANPTIDTGHLFAVNPEGWIVKDWPANKIDDPRLAVELEAMIKANAKGK